MKKLYAHFLAYNSYNIIEEALPYYEEKMGIKPERKLLVDPQFPGEAQPFHSMKLGDLAQKYGWEYVRTQNFGVGGNWNFVVKHLDLKDGDVLVGCDPDGRPQQKEWLASIMDIFNNAPECFTVQLNQAGVYALNLQRQEKKIGNTWVIDYAQTTSWSLGAFDVGWLKRFGGFLQRSKVYGHCESMMNELAHTMGGKVYMTKDCYDAHLETPNEDYRKWKLESACYKTDKDFAVWLAEKKRK